MVLQAALKLSQPQAPAKMSALRATRSLSIASQTAHTTIKTSCARPFSFSARNNAEGDTGGTRRGGERSMDSWSKREKAAEDMYIKEREKAIMQLLKAKIAQQEELLAKDRAMLSTMEDQYGHIAEERAAL